MRPLIIQELNNIFHTDIFTWLVPHGSLILGIAFITVLIIFIYRSSEVGLSRSYALWSGIWAIAFGLIGSRIYYLLQHTDTVLKSPNLILTGGSGSFGGYIGGTLGFMISLKLYKAKILRYLDTVSSSFGIGIFIGRCRCFLEGCCFGTVSTGPWSVKFPPNTYAYNFQVSEGLISSDATRTLSVHPVQIYSAINGLILFFLASMCWKKYRNTPAITVCFFWLSWCVTRFVLEFFRGERTYGLAGPFTTPQLLCIIIVILLVVCMYFFLHNTTRRRI
jgi:phosphatidylglycerol:prolipoprotein diacylglycerol transferase